MAAVKKKAVLSFLTVALAGSLLVVCAAQTASNTERDELKPLARNSEPQNQSLFDTDPNFSAESGFGSGGGELFYRAMITVLFVIVLGFGAFYVSRKVLPRIARLPGKEIRVVETTYLGPHKALHLVEIGGRRLMIGSTNNNITKLMDITDEFTDTSTGLSGDNREYK